MEKKNRGRAGGLPPQFLYPTHAPRSSSPLGVAAAVRGKRAS